MNKLILAAVATAALAAPAVAQREPIFDERMDDERAPSLVRPGDDPRDPLVAAIPSAGEIEAMAPALDRSLAALLNVDVGPLLDAADPYRRRPGYGRPGRTLGELGRRDDPYFEQRLRSSLYGATGDMARMMEAFAVAAPSLRRSLSELERGMEAAIDDYHRRRGDRRGYRDDGPYPDED